ncbi:MAG: thioredoxin domain-containing protein [Lewinellaceae bacterium]|nr:thioredoxin domain-containing protein [Lewinellaceae bacterium]
MNRLRHETSPYLLQHANNPVDWHPWGEEALSRAKKEDKPILISIGYATCHWCHVMERESFQDADIAAFMNEFFINIKIDREERPDLDALYMEAGHLLNRTSGWPLNCFLTPDGKPFFAGSYFPPEPGAKQMAWFQALQYVLYNFRENRQAVEQQAERITRSLQELNREDTAPAPELSFFASPFPSGPADQAFEQLTKRFDRETGGFGEAPKFPDLLQLQFLLHYHFFTKSDTALGHLLFSLDKILRSGIYDAVGGGLARYAVDRQWRIPHFEKTLYDNALFARLLADVYSITGQNRWKDHLDKTLQFLRRDLSSGEGAYYSGLDAESEGVEGKYYTWSWGELEKILPAGLFEKAVKIFSLKKEGNWEGTNILFQAVPAEDEDLQAVFRILARERDKRTRPKRDTKVLLGWNALVVSAFARAFEVTGDESYRREALGLVQFLLATFWSKDKKSLLRVSTQGKTHQEALLQDYAFLAQALLDIHRITWDAEWLQKSLILSEDALATFADLNGALFYTNALRGEKLIVRTKDTQDLELPSGNSAMRQVLHQLGLLYGRSDLSERAARMLLTMKKAMSEHPAAHVNWWSQWLIESYGAYEIALIGPAATEMANQVRKRFLPHAVLLPSETESNAFPLLEGRPAGDPVWIYVCQEQSCMRPVASLEELYSLLEVDAE